MRKSGVWQVGLALGGGTERHVRDVISLMGRRDTHVSFLSHTYARAHTHTHIHICSLGACFSISSTGVLHQGKSVHK